jgi:hypothetical protein
MNSGFSHVLTVNGPCLVSSATGADGANFPILMLGELEVSLSVNGTLDTNYAEMRKRGFKWGISQALSEDR